MLSFGLYAFLFLSVRSRSEEIFDHAQSLHRQLERLSAVLGYVERRSYRSSPQLAKLCRPLLQQHNRPSASLKQAASIMNRLSVRAHPSGPLPHQCHWPLGPRAHLPLQQLQDRIAAIAPLWFETLAELDAAASLATFAYLHPDYPWPSLSQPDKSSPQTAIGRSSTPESGPSAHSRDGTHRQRRPAKGRGRIFLVTGSNMSGKSTFLRTIGINTCLAQAGGPVCAESFRWSLVRIGSCIRVDDSLDSGLSFFYAEVKRLKTILDCTQDEQRPPVLWLIDEVFKGTNNRERLIGGRALIATLAGGNGFGLGHDPRFGAGRTGTAAPRRDECALSGNRGRGRAAFRLSPETGPLPHHQCPADHGARGSSCRKPCLDPTALNNCIVSGVSAD